jgi:hypothetical protein
VCIDHWTVGSVVYKGIGSHAVNDILKSALFQTKQRRGGIYSIRDTRIVEEHKKAYDHKEKALLGMMHIDPANQQQDI